VAASGFTAAINQLAFGAGPGEGGGDACGRCFALTATADPYSPAFTGPFNSIVVKVTDLWCVNYTRELKLMSDLVQVVEIRYGNHTSVPIPIPAQSSVELVLTVSE